MLSFNQPPVAPTTEESTGHVLVWPCYHFTSCQPPRSNPSSCDSAVHLGRAAAGHSRLCCTEQHGDRVPVDPLSQDLALVSVPALHQPRHNSHSAGRKLQSKWHSVPMLNICSPRANSGNTHSGKHAALCTVGFSVVHKTLLTHPPTAS